MLDRASFKAYGDLLANARLREAFFNASLISVIAAVALTLISLAIAWIVLRAKLKRAWLLDALAMIPLGVPPLMTGIALVFVAFSLKFLPLYGTIWIIALGHVIAFMPIASRMMQSGMLQITGELEEAAHMAGATAARTVWRVLLPLLVPTLMAMIVWILVHSVREFSIAVMLQSGRNGVLSTMLFNFWETGSPERAAALAVMLMTLLLALTATFSLLTPRERAN
jgi:iron(III) transport system permease protein